jgi:predicted nucleic acid-binding Zn ribbon protein
MIDARDIPPCVVCGQHTCTDYRTCAGELADICRRITERANAERPERERVTT